MSRVVEVRELVYLHPQGGRGLRGVGLHVDAGETVGVLGPNGSGKSTLFRVLSTLATPQSGSAAVAGCDVVGDRGGVRARVGVVFQQPALDKELTGRENLLIYARLHGLADPAARADELLSLLEVADRAGEPVKRLSGGLRRRIEFARALMTRPAVLLMDEPTLGLDPGARRNFWGLLRAARPPGSAVLVTTHLLDEAGHCDRLYLLDDGRVIASGTPADLTSRVGGEVLTVEVADPADVGQVAEALAGSGEAKVAGTQVRVVTPGPAADVLAQVMNQMGSRLRSGTVGRPGLEDAYHALTGRPFDGVQSTSGQSA